MDATVVAPSDEGYWSKAPAASAPSDESYWSKATDSSNPQADVDQPSREVYTAEDRLNSDQQIAHATDTRPVIQRGPNAPVRFDLGPSPVPSNPGQSLFRQEVEQQKGAPLAITPAGAVPVPEGTPVGAPPKPMVPGLELGTDHVVAHDPTTGAVIPSRNPLDAGRPITDEDAAQRAEFGKQLANPEQVGNQIAPGFGSMADAPVELAKGNVKGAVIKALGGAGEFGAMAIAPEALEIAASAEFGPAIKLAVALGGGQAGDSVIRKVGAERGWKPEDIELASQAVQWLPAGIYAGARMAGVKTVGGEIPKAEPGTDLPSEAGVNAPEPGTKFKGVTAFPDKETGRPRVAAGVSTSPEGERTAAVRVGDTSVGIDLSRKGAKPSEESYWKPATEAPDGEAEGRPVVQASANPEELRKSAAAQQPDLEQSVKAVTSQVPGTDLEGSRVKDAESQANKEDRGKPNETNIDHLGARVSAETPEARAKVEQAVRDQLPVVSEDKIDANHTDATQFGIKTGEKGDANQVSELQVVDKPMAEAMKETDSLYGQQKQALAVGDEQKAHDIGSQIAEIHKAAQAQVGDEDDLEQARRGAAAQPEVPSQLSTNGVPKEQRASTQIARDEQQKMGERIAGRNETKAAIEKPAEEQPTKYKFGNTQANIPDDSEAAQSLNTVRQRISKLDLAGKGKDIGDGGNHVTVRYGIQGEDTEGIKRYIESLSPFDASLGKTETFPPSEHSDGAAVIQAPINSPELHKINGEIQKHGDFAPSSFPDYAPHATIAYVKPEKAQRYVGMTVTNGKKFHVDQIAIAKKDGSQEIVKLKGAGSAAGPSAVSKTTSEGSSPSAPAKAPEHPITLPAEAQEELKKPGSFIGVDLDKTLAKYDEWKGKTNIGEPIENTVNQVKQWLAEGKDVKIFTARVADDPGGIAKRAIEDWTEKHLGKRLDVTHEKSPHMVAQVDDRGIHVAPNEGIPTGGEHAVPERGPEAILQREPAENRPESGGRIQQREQRNESARPRAGEPAAQGNQGNAVQKEEAREITSATSSVPSMSSGRERMVLEGISKMLEHGARNDAVRSVVEELSDDQVDPHPIMEEFWSSTYPALPEKGKRQFEHQISSMIGLKPGDVISVNAKQGTHQVAKSWREIVDGGLAKKTGDMEHGEQAVVGLAQILNEMRRKAESGIPIAEAPKAISGKEEGTVKSRHGKIIDISSGEHGRTGTQAVGTSENSNRGVVPAAIEHAEKPGQRSNLLEFKSEPQVYRTDSKEKATGRVITFTPKAAPRADHIGDLNRALELESTDPDAAAAIYRSLIKTGDKHTRASAYVNLAVLSSINRNFTEAVELTKKAVEIDPDFAQARFNLASGLEDSGRAREAIIEYEKAKRLAPKWADPYYNLARAYQRLRDSTKALKNYRAFLTLESGTPFSEHARHEITRLTEHMTLINGGGNSVDTTAAQGAHLSVVTQGTVKKVEGSNKRSLAARVANDPDVAKLQPEESVEKGKNFEGRYLRATLEPVKTAWMKAVSNTRGDSADDHWKWMVKHVTAPNEAVRPDGYKQDSIYAGIPGDGAFLIPNTPRAIEHALRSADRFGTPIKQTSQLPAKTSVPRSPKEFDNAKYVSNLKEEIADLEKGISRASHTTTPHLEYLKESLKLAKENLADATKGSVTLRSGFLDPELFKQHLGPIAAPVADWLKEKISHVQQAKEVNEGLADLGSMYQADVLRAVQTMKDAPGSAKDFAVIYHWQEDPNRKLTPEQENIYTQWIKPMLAESSRIYTKLTDGGVPVDNYVHRVVQDRGSLIDRIMAGGKSSGQGNVLSRYSPATKSRTMMALENEETGKRSVVSVKRGRVMRWIDGHAVDMGALRPGMATKGGLLDDLIRPINDKIAELEQERRLLRETKGRIQSSFQRRKNITEEVDRLERQRELILGSVTEDHLRDQVFVDKDGKQWKFDQATTREIEADTNLKYYHNALGSAITNYLNLRKSERAFDYLETLKSSPEFSGVAKKIDAGIPDGWKMTTLPQLHGYAFEPHIAETLNRYAEKLTRDPGVLEKVNQFLRTSIFFNPLIHIPNIAAHALVEKGVSGWMPWNWPTMVRSGMKAINAVVHQNADYLAALDQGAPLQYMRFENKQFADLFFKKMAKELEANGSVAQKVAKALGYLNPAALIKSIYEVSGRSTWFVNDLAFLQSTYEKTARGVGLKDALEETGKHIPTYRIPAHILGSRSLSKLMDNPLLTMFGSYHYGALRSYGELMKDAIGPESTGSDRAAAFDKMAMLALLMLVIYPAADKLVKRLSGNDNAVIRRAGPSTFPYALYQLAEGKRTPTDALTSVVTPAVGTKAAVELAFNRKLRTGERIYNPATSAENIAKDIAVNSVAESISPVQQATRAIKDETAAERLRWGAVGVSFPENTTPALRLAREYAKDNGVGSSRLTGAADDRHKAMRAVEQMFRQERPDDAVIDRYVEQRILTRRDVREAQLIANADPLVYIVRGLSVDQALNVYKHADADEKERLRKLVQDKIARAQRDGRETPSLSGYDTELSGGARSASF